MDIVIEAAVEAAGELLSAGIDAVVDKAVKHKSCLLYTSDAADD